MPTVVQSVRKQIAASGVLVLAASLTACPSQVAPPAVAAVTILGGDRTLVIGEIVELAAEVSPEGADDSLSWESEEPDLATVVGSGTNATVTAVAPGTTTITATSVTDPTRFGTVEVTVFAPGAVLWTEQFGTGGYDDVVDVATDGEGRAIVAGETQGALGSTSLGLMDAFVRVLGAEGEHHWTRQFGTSADDFGRAVAWDPEVGIVVAGDTWGSLAGTSAGNQDGFLRRYDADGDLLWTRQFGSASLDAASSIAVDTDGNVYVVGATQGELGATNSGLSDAYVRKYDRDGVHVWTRQFGTASGGALTDVAVDPTGSVVVAGYTGGSLEGVSAGGNDFLVRRYDANGDHVWTRQFGTAADDRAYGVACDGDGNVIVVGFTAGDLGAASLGSWDAFVRWYDADGNHLRSEQFGTAGSEVIQGIATDAQGNVLVSGYTSGSLSGPNAGGTDALVRKYAPDGAPSWTRQFGTSEDDFAFGAAMRDHGGGFVAGYTYGALTGSSAGSVDGFVRGYGP